VLTTRVTSVTTLDPPTSIIVDSQLEIPVPSLKTSNVILQQLTLQILELLPQRLTIRSRDLADSLFDLETRVSIPLILLLFSNTITLLQRDKTFIHPLL